MYAISKWSPMSENALCFDSLCAWSSLWDRASSLTLSLPFEIFDLSFRQRLRFVGRRELQSRPCGMVDDSCLWQNEGFCCSESSSFDGQYGFI